VSVRTFFLARQKHPTDNFHYLWALSCLALPFRCERFARATKVDAIRRRALREVGWTPGMGMLPAPRCCQSRCARGVAGGPQASALVAAARKRQLQLQTFDARLRVEQGAVPEGTALAVASTLVAAPPFRPAKDSASRKSAVDGDTGVRTSALPCLRAHGPRAEPRPRGGGCETASRHGMLGYAGVGAGLNLSSFSRSERACSC
jgi:hypothetical protein